jgi:quercetin dioxygenase-like cupin family protein
MNLNPYAALAEVNMTPVVTRKLLAYQEGENGYTINLLKAKAGAVAPLHSHPHLQVVYVLSGKGDFRVGDEVQTITAGDVIQIDANVPHTFDSVAEDTEWMEFFTPNREDYKPE